MDRQVFDIIIVGAGTAGCLLANRLSKKELQKSKRWLSKTEMTHLKVWALATFSQYKGVILEVFDQIS